MEEILKLNNVSYRYSDAKENEFVLKNSLSFNNSHRLDIEKSVYYKFISNCVKKV